MPKTSAAGRQSYYLPTAVADALDKAADDLHYGLRLPKNVVMGAIIQYGLDHLAEVRQALTDAEQPGAATD